MSPTAAAAVERRPRRADSGGDGTSATTAAAAAAAAKANRRALAPLLPLDTSGSLTFAMVTSEAVTRGVMLMPLDVPLALQPPLAHRATA